MTGFLSSTSNLPVPFGASGFGGNKRRNDSYKSLLTTRMMLAINSTKLGQNSGFGQSPMYSTKGVFSELCGVAHVPRDDEGREDDAEGTAGSHEFRHPWVPSREISGRRHNHQRRHRLLGGDDPAERIKCSPHPLSGVRGVHCRSRRPVRGWWFTEVVVIAFLNGCATRSRLLSE